MSNRRIVPLIILSLLVGSCAPRSRPTSPPPRVYLSEHACQRPYLTSLISQDDFYEVQRPVLAGGVVTSGDFVIAIWLYCDPSLDSDDPYGGHYSEVRLLGFRYEWEHLGLPIETDSHTSVAINGDELSGTGGGPGVGTGDTETTTGEITTPSQVVARAVANSQPVEFVVTISAPDRIASAVLRVLFASAPDGYRVVRSEVASGSTNTR